MKRLRDYEISVNEAGNGQVISLYDDIGPGLIRVLACPPRAAAAAFIP